MTQDAVNASGKVSVCSMANSSWFVGQSLCVSVTTFSATVHNKGQVNFNYTQRVCACANIVRSKLMALASLRRLDFNCFAHCGPSEDTMMVKYQVLQCL